MGEPDVLMSRIGEGIALRQRGEPDAARRLFARLWAEISADGDAVHRCALAHSIADVQDEVGQELLWDLRALEAAESITEEQMRQSGMAGQVGALYPSLHLNLADAYRRLGNLDQARYHVEQGRAAVGHLGDDDYGRMITDALERLATQLGPA